MICEKCNYKNSKNAKFCSNCGHNLIELDIKEDNNSFSAIFKNILSDLKGILIKPIVTMENFIKAENYMTGLLYLGINIIVIAIITLLSIDSTYNIFSGLYNYDLDCIDSLFCTPVEIPYFKIFMIVIMTGVITYALLAGVISVTNNYLFKAKTSFKKMITWLGINSIFNTLSVITIAISFFIGSVLGIIVFLCSTFIYIYNLFKSIEYATDINKNNLGYLLTISLTVTILVMIIVLPIVLY